MKIKVLLILLLVSNLELIAQKDGFELIRANDLIGLKNLINENDTIINQKNKEGFTLLILASYKGKNEIVDFLLKNGAEVNAISEMGTALMAAVVVNNTEIITRLIDAGADVNLNDNAQRTALHLAVQFRNKSSVELLLFYNADKTKIDSKGKTAFEYAVFSGNNEIINLLK